MKTDFEKIVSLMEKQEEQKHLLFFLWWNESKVISLIKWINGEVKEKLKQDKTFIKNIKQYRKENPDDCLTFARNKYWILFEMEQNQEEFFWTIVY